MSTAFNKIVDTMRQVNRGDINTVASTIVYGTVVKTSPLSISVNSDIDPLPASFFILGYPFKKHKAKITHTHDGISGVYEDYVEIEPYDPLAPGDRVVLLSFNRGQKYYVAEKLT